MLYMIDNVVTQLHTTQPGDAYYTQGDYFSFVSLGCCMNPMCYNLNV